MADITGNFSVNPHGYTNENISKKASQPAQSSCHGEEVKKPEIDLGKDPNAISGKTLVRTSNVGRKPEGYEFDPKKVEEDVREFQAYYAVKDTMDEYKKDLVKNGYDPVAADEKAMMFADCLLSNENV